MRSGRNAAARAAPRGGWLAFLKRLLGGGPVRPTRRRCRLALEPLEARLVPAVTAQQVYMLELVNEMRTDPADTLPVLLHSSDAMVNEALSYFNVDTQVLEQQWAGLTPVPPVAFSDALNQSALGHSQLMAAADTLSHQLPGEPDFVTRMQNAGYTGGYGWGENITTGNSVFENFASLAIDWGSGANGSVGGMQNPAGHRENLMDPSWPQMGIGIVTDANGQLWTTQDFGAAPAGPFVVGAVFSDPGQTGMYDPNGGLSGVTLTFTSGTTSVTTTTTDGGGYQVQLAPGTYTVTATGGGLAQTLTQTATVGSSTNLFLNFDATRLTGLTVSPATLPVATVGTAYSAITLDASGGSGSYRFALAPGSMLPAGLTLQAGVLSGTPKSAGTFAFVVTATDTTNASALGSQRYTLTIDPALVLRAQTLPIATVGDALSVQLSATGGSGQGYQFQASSLPAWLTVSADGTLSGTPLSTTGSAVSLTVNATDSAGGFAQRTYRLALHPALTVSPGTLPAATANTSLRVQLHAAGGTGTGYRFSATGLPAGLTLSPAGVLSGVPTTAPATPQSLAIAVTVTDSIKANGSATYVLTVDPPLLVGTASLPTATAGIPYALQLSAVGGAGSGYTFAAVGRPSWLTLSSTGLLSGTPRAGRAVPITVVVRDPNHAVARHAFTLAVDPVLTVKPGHLLPATVGSAYQVQLTAAGGSGGGYQFSASGLPSWLTLSSTGLLSGTPDAVPAVPVTFTLTVTDAIGAIRTVSFSLVIDPALSLGPDTLPAATAGSSYRVQLTALGGSGTGYHFSATGLPASLKLSATGLLSGSVPAALPVTFTVTLTDRTGATISQSYTLSA